MTTTKTQRTAGTTVADDVLENALREIAKRDAKLAGQIGRLARLQAPLPEFLGDQLERLIRMIEPRIGMIVTEQRQRERFAADVAEAIPRRAEHIAAFVAERIILAAGSETPVNDVKRAYRDFQDDHRVPRLEWLTEDELLDAVLELANVEPARVYQAGELVDGVRGLRIGDQYRQARDTRAVSWNVPA